MYIQTDKEIVKKLIIAHNESALDAASDYNYYLDNYKNNNWEAIASAMPYLIVKEDEKTPKNNKIDTFAAICDSMKETYRRKNADYGDSFSKSIDKYGLIAALTRMSDKWNRLENLILNGGNNQVADEKLEDTLLDLANYAIMLKMYLEERK